MSKNIKTVFKVFDYLHIDDYARYLEEMAAKGWHFKEWGAGLKFEKGEPEQVEYAVEVFSKASENDLRPEPHTQEFAEYCEAAGWELIDAKQKYCIFKKEKTDAVDILTQEERVKNSFKATLSVSYIILFVLYGMNAAIQWINMLGIAFSTSIFSTMSFFNVAVWSFMFVSQFVKFVYAFIMRHKWLKQIKKGQEVYIGNNKDGKKWWDGYVFNTGVLLTLFLLLLLMLEDVAQIILFVLVFVFTLTFSFVLAKVRPDTNTNIAIQVVFCVVLFIGIVISTFSIFSEDKDSKNDINKVPLQISDYREYSGEIEDISIYQQKNMLGSSESYFLFGEEESIYYGIYRSDHDWILDRIWNDEVGTESNIAGTDCAKEWDAIVAFRNQIGEYYVRYEDILLIFSEDEEIVLVPEQIEIIRDKLDLR